MKIGFVLFGRVALVATVPLLSVTTRAEADRPTQPTGHTATVPSLSVATSATLPSVDWIRDFTVDGKRVQLAPEETRLDFTKIYPGEVVKGKICDRWATIEATVERPADETVRFRIEQDWFGSFVLNGESFAKELNGDQVLYFRLRKGVNTFAFRSRSGINGKWHFGIGFDAPRKPGEPLATIDLGVTRGKIRPALHSSGFGPLVCSCPEKRINLIKSMNFAYARTHDWALINPNQRVCDWHHIFPLKDLDATNPANYVFGPTDYLLKRTREETGLEIYYRLGTSIEHSGNKVHFNALIPDDFDKVAEVFAGTVRHYNRGWANGFNWNIKYWEIWNEPDGHETMWCLPGGDGESGTPGWYKNQEVRKDKFIRFFVTCLKRLKSEFPDIKVGGPALCNATEDYFRDLLAACREAGVAPDFVSWHYYGADVEAILDGATRMRRLCDSMGFKDCELILNEWHFLNANWTDFNGEDPAVLRRIHTGPASHNGTDSVAFTLATLARFQVSSLDQAYFYGCSHFGNWGFLDANRNPNKAYYGLVMFGSIMRDYAILGDVKTTGSLTTLVAKTADGAKTALLVVDYLGAAGDIVLDLEHMPKGRPTALVIDDARNLEAVDVKLEGRHLILPKTGVASASYLVTFE